MKIDLIRKKHAWKLIQLWILIWMKVWFQKCQLCKGNLIKIRYNSKWLLEKKSKDNRISKMKRCERKPTWERFFTSRYGLPCCLICLSSWPKLCWDMGEIVVSQTKWSSFATFSGTTGTRLSSSRLMYSKEQRKRNLDSVLMRYGKCWMFSKLC